MRIAAARIAAVGCLAFSAANARAQTLQKDVDQYLHDVVAAGDFNGVVLIARGDSILASKAYGFSDINPKKPLTMESRFRTASVTKTFTAALASILAEEGKLSYTDSVSRFIPSFPNGNKIKIRQLLLHSSGIANPSTPTCANATLGGIVKELEGKPLDFEPGTKSRYSNGGYALAARVEEVASGVSWSQLFQQKIVAPLKLRETSVDSRTGTIPDRARGFAFAGGPAGVERVQCEGAWAAIGSGAVVSSAPDLYRWARSVRNDVLFKRSALEYPYGWGVRKYYDRSVIEQSGIVSGFSSYVAAYLNEDVYVVALANIQTGMLVELGKGLAAIALGQKPAALAASPPAVAWTKDERAHWIGEFHSDNVGTMALTESGNELRLRWGNSPETLFITSTGPSHAYDKVDSIDMSLSADHDSVTMRWGNGDVQILKRLPAGKGIGSQQ